ncbi:glycosyltransferase family protein [Neorhizobium alkalisoli]|uniref:Glycosyltransferase involved in cell wall biosynthesis n=1 Tax=Neorhizobium alkalisoli TaxID=528178 RepID=A0A561R3G2_9HYPH|nr:glycosyltransferase [Neorhizobium alkalisoli]TWF57152.1 glycosyltransferase involved in cell wall biosynthesis [Neorhizobium alkalisoli]
MESPDKNKEDEIAFLKAQVTNFGSQGLELFDEEYYLDANPDVKAAGLDAFSHFVEIGWREGRAPSKHFDVAFYLSEYPDVLEANINPLFHYAEYGINEGRKPLPRTDRAGARDAYEDSASLTERQLFDSTYYLLKNPDVKASNMDPFEHFMQFGWREGRSPSEQFSLAFYLNQYPDIRAAGINPLTHYVEYGHAEGRLPLPEKDAPISAVHFDFPIAGAGMALSLVRNGFVTGAALDPSAKVTEVEILVGKKPVVSGLCVKQKPDRENSDRLPSGSGFALSIPLSVRYDSINDFAIRFRGKPSTRRPLHWTGTAHPRALFIPNARLASDGSRIYRAELPAQQLRASGVEVTIMEEEDAISQVAENSLDLGQYDLILLQRVPYSDAMVNLVKQARRYNRLVLYDVDDLMFKPWLRAEMGVIRSGTYSFNDENYRDSLQRRLDMLLLCQGVICSTPFLQRELASLGMPAILSRNALDDRSFIDGALRLAQDGVQEGFKMLFMSGTPTHEMDFRLIKDVVAETLLSNPNITLTILGELRDTGLDHLPNVNRLPAVTREEMLKIVAQHDVLLVPLERTRFNLAKSSLKFMEAGAAGVPVIASNLFEFERDIRKSGAGVIARTAADWRQAIQFYIDHRGLAREHGAKAFRYCLDNHSNQSRNGYLWREICRFDEHLTAEREFVDGVDNRLYERMITAIRGSV